MKKSIFSRILVIAAGVILIAAAATIRQSKASDWQYAQFYGYDVWCDLSSFCSGPISKRYLLLGQYPYWENPLETHYGLCEWLPPYGLEYGIPCGCVEMHTFYILDEHVPCGFMVPIS